MKKLSNKQVKRLIILNIDVSTIKGIKKGERDRAVVENRGYHHVETIQQGFEKFMMVYDN